MAERIHGFGVLTFAHTLGYLCKSSWQSARPHYLSANRGHAERQGKTLKRQEQGREGSSQCSGFMQTGRANPPVASISPQTPRLGPAHHLPSADGHSGSRCFWQIFYGNTETEIPAWPPLRVFHKAGWPLPRRRRYRHPETEEHSKLHILTGFKI